MTNQEVIRALTPVNGNFFVMLRGMYRNHSVYLMAGRLSTSNTYHHGEVLTVHRLIEYLRTRAPEVTFEIRDGMTIEYPRKIDASSRQVEFY